MFRSTPRFALKAALVAGTTLLPLVVGKLVIPLDWYTFRSWEVLVDRRPAPLAAGPFYPNQTLRRVEVGDLGARTPFAVEKHVEWYTDAYGFRNRTAEGPHGYDVVIVGDSVAAGSSLTQADTLAEMIGALSGQRVYSYAPSTMAAFLRDERFRARPPAAVVFVGIERNLYQTVLSPPPPPVTERLYGRYVPEPLTVGLDRVRKKPLLTTHLYRALRGRPAYPAVVDEEHRMLFLPDALRWDARYRADPRLVRRTAAAIASYRAAAAERDIRFIFVPVPDKKTVYWDFLQAQPGAPTEPPPFLGDLVELARTQGVEVVDLEPAYRSERAERGTLLYHRDDTHWNAQAVAMAAELITDRLDAAVASGG